MADGYEEIIRVERVMPSEALYMARQEQTVRMLEQALQERQSTVYPVVDAWEWKGLGVRA